MWAFLRCENAYFTAKMKIFASERLAIKSCPLEVPAPPLAGVHVVYAEARGGRARNEPKGAWLRTKH